MKYLLFVLPALVGFISSCSSTYYYSTLSSNDEGISRDSLGSFVFNTDTIQVIYSFQGHDGPIQISVHNKLNRPMYIDWSRSAIIINDVATSYAEKEANPADQVIGSEALPYSSSSKTTTLGYMYNPSYVSFVPPMRKIQHCSLSLSNLSFGYINKKEYENGVVRNAHNRDVKIKTLSFSEENTPLFFESYLTISLENGSTYTITQSFYIANLIQTKKLQPSGLSKDLADRKDLVFSSAPANNKGWKILACCGKILLTGTVIIGGIIFELVFGSS